MKNNLNSGRTEIAVLEKKKNQTRFLQNAYHLAESIKQEQGAIERSRTPRTSNEGEAENRSADYSHSHRSTSIVSEWN